MIFPFQSPRFLSKFSEINLIYQLFFLSSISRILIVYFLLKLDYYVKIETLAKFQLDESALKVLTFFVHYISPSLFFI